MRNLIKESFRQGVNNTISEALTVALSKLSKGGNSQALQDYKRLSDLKYEINAGKRIILTDDLMNKIENMIEKELNA